MIFRITSALLLFSAALNLSCESADTGRHVPDPSHAVWLYDFETFDNAAVTADLRQRGIGCVFMSVSAQQLSGKNFDKAYTSKLSSFIAAAGGCGIAVHAMICEQPSYALTASHQAALDEIDGILAYCAAHPEASPDGIHLDIEPHALGQWQNAPDYTGEIQEKILAQFLSLLDAARLKVPGTTLKLSAALPWWYDSKFREGILASGNPSLFAARLDFAAIVSYSAAVDVYEQAENELEAMPVYFGLYAPNYATLSALEAERVSVTQRSGANKNFLGCAVFEYTTYGVQRQNRTAPSQYR